MTGMPFGGGTTDKTSIAAEIADAKAELDDRRYKVEQEYVRLQKFISSVDDPRMRLIIQYRCIDGRSWQNIAMKLGAYNSAGSVKKAYYRFIKTV